MRISHEANQQIRSQRLPSQAYQGMNRPSQLLSQGFKSVPSSKSCSGGASHFFGNTGGGGKLASCFTRHLHSSVTVLLPRSEKQKRDLQGEVVWLPQSDLGRVTKRHRCEGDKHKSLHLVLQKMGKGSSWFKMFPQLKREHISEESLLVVLSLVATNRSNQYSSLKI